MKLPRRQTKIAQVRAQDLDMFYLGHSGSGQRLERYSVDKLQQSKKRKRKPMRPKKRRGSKKSRLEQRMVFVYPWGEQKATKTA